MPVQIHIIGLGVAVGARLTTVAEAALQSSRVVIGSVRQLGLAKAHLNAEQTDTIDFIVLPKLSELKALILSNDVAIVALLASGDPHYFGIGHWMSRQFDASQLHFHCAISSVQAVCNHLGLSQQYCRVVSLHGRDIAGIRRELKQHQTLIVLTDQHSHPQALAQSCIDAGFDDSTLWVCEDIGSEHECYRHFNVKPLVADDSFSCSALHVSVIRTQGLGGVLPEFPGIPDDWFVTGAAKGQGMITKREVRLTILSLMQPSNEDVIWDIGAGCGGVATELAYWNRRVSVYAIEQHPARLSCLQANQGRFGTGDNLHIIDGRAPQALADLVPANKVFIGGNDGELNDILKFVWARLPANGLLVVSAVTDNTRCQLEAFALPLADDQVESLQIAVSRGERADDQMTYKAKLPITLYQFIKRGDDL